MTDRPAPPAESPHTTGLRRAVALGTGALVVLMLLSAALWTVLDGTPGLWGALMGAAIGGVFVLLTAVVMVATARSTPHITGAVLLGTWLLKLIVAIGVVAALKPLDFYSKRAFAVTLVIAMVVVLATETLAIIRNPAPVVEPVPGQ